MAAARKKAKAKAKTKAKTRARKAARPKKSAKGRKASIKRPKRNTEAKAPLAEMDAAWQSLLETALARHRAEHDASPARSRTSKKK